MYLPEIISKVSQFIKPSFPCPGCNLNSNNLEELKKHFKDHKCYNCDMTNLKLPFIHVMEKCQHLLCSSCCVALEDKFKFVPIECNKCIKDKKIEFSKKYYWDQQCSVPLSY